ncbi:hypothetical protein EV651_110305 [Kribbella sp. VKM Ac-2571]|uniref:hypothetical protein n=1 Tax=Kribbella sp. VKM Ac-2571 TaxID=2512222 RepID=UPI00106219A1|nr:hypothetical protein [Kribbella sp. VKM Ac-2571]TDO58269.1 hypothetical protein EV651_110305 [Kribbella sp. VKM Ac-2571]
MRLFLKPVVRYQLGHVRSQAAEWRVTEVKYTTKYVISPVEFTTPQEGSAVETRTCPGCRTLILVEVASVQEVRRDRLRSFGWGIVVLLIAALVASLLLVVPEGAYIPIVIVDIFVCFSSLRSCTAHSPTAAWAGHQIFRARSRWKTLC